MFIFNDEQQSNASAGLKEPVPDQFSTRWQTAREALRWRGLLFSSLLAAREVLRPIMYWHAWHIFHTDLQRPLMEPYAKGRVVVKVSAAKENLEDVSAQISSMGNLPWENVHSRFDRGDAAAVAYVDREPAGYMWMTFADGMDLAFGVNWIVHPHEALRYGSFVVPRWRGLGIHSVLNRALNDCARARGLTRTLGAISALNVQSLSLAKHARNPKVMTLVLIHIRGINRTYCKTAGAPFDSRFVRSPQKYLTRGHDPVSDDV
jgi:GNAT superfamily N-acetyltransferase